MGIINKMRRSRTGGKYGSQKQPRMVSFRELRELQRQNESSHMGPGATEYAKPFGSDVKNKMHFGGKYKTKINNNPPPGLYDPNPEVIKPRTPGFSMSSVKAKRSDFTS